MTIKSIKKLVEKKKIEKYNCSIHGGNGDHACEECRENLKKLAKDNNAQIIGDF